jgi:hypothetical protein
VKTSVWLPIADAPRDGTDMNTNQQNTTIAELCGRTNHTLSSEDDDFRECPSYTIDLNAMHAAEETLKWSETDAYVDTLARIVDPTHGYRMDLTFSVAVATAAQRAEAFLRVHRKWEGNL